MCPVKKTRVMNHWSLGKKEYYPKLFEKELVEKKSNVKAGHYIANEILKQVKIDFEERYQKNFN